MVGICSKDHIEWHHRDIFMMEQRTYEEQGISSGIVGIRSKPYYCSSAGLTRVGTTVSLLENFPVEALINHALILDQLPPCRYGTDPSSFLQAAQVVARTAIIIAGDESSQC